MSILVNIVRGILTAYWYILLATAIISWIPDLSETQVGQWLHRLTEPYLRLFRRFIRPLPIGGIQLDLAWIVAVIVFFVIQDVVNSLLAGLMWRLSG